MGSSVVDLGPGLVVALLALTALAAAAGWGSGLDQHRPVVVAAARATAQLGAVSAVLMVVLDSLWLVAVFVLFMLVVAAATSAGRVTGRPVRAPGMVRRTAATGVAILSGAAPVVALVLASGAVPLSGEAVVPVAGIVIGGTMTTTSLAGRRLREQVQQRRGEVEAALALGLVPREAVLEIARPVAATALVPALDQTRTVGLVTLPGAFVACCSAAAAPSRPAPPSCWCWSGWLAAEALAVWVTVELVAAGRLGG